MWRNINIQRKKTRPNNFYISNSKWQIWNYILFGRVVYKLTPNTICVTGLHKCSGSFIWLNLEVGVNGLDTNISPLMTIHKHEVVNKLLWHWYKKNPGLDDDSCFVMSREVSAKEVTVRNPRFASVAVQDASFFRLLTYWRTKRLERYFRGRLE